MNDLTVIRFAGRCFSSEDVALMCQAARDYASLGITEIARTVCEWLDWKRPNGRLKNHECRLRSEEHTSELQSRLHLVCRLLLEKKKKKNKKKRDRMKTVSIRMT